MARKSNERISDEPLGKYDVVVPLGTFQYKIRPEGTEGTNWDFVPNGSNERFPGDPPGRYDVVVPSGIFRYLHRLENEAGPHYEFVPNPTKNIQSGPAAPTEQSTKDEASDI